MCTAFFTEYGKKVIEVIIIMDRAGNIVILCTSTAVYLTCILYPIAYIDLSAILQEIMCKSTCI